MCGRILYHLQDELHSTHVSMIWVFLVVIELFYQLVAKWDPWCWSVRWYWLCCVRFIAVTCHAYFYNACRLF